MDERLFDVFVRLPETEVHIASYRSTEQYRFLSHHGNAGSEVSNVVLTDIDPVNADNSFCRIVESKEKLSDGRLSGSRGSSDSDVLPSR